MTNNKTLRDLAESWAATELDIECDAGRDSRPDRLCDKCRQELEAAIEGYIAGFEAANKPTQYTSLPAEPSQAKAANSND